MTVLDSFYFLFKSNAKDAASDVEKLDAQIVKTGHSTRKAFLEEQKQQAELKKQRLDATQNLRDQTKVTETLGDSLLSLGLKALTAYASFETIKTLAKDTQDFNLGLQRTSALTGQNAEQIEAWDKAFQNLGADQGSFKNWYTGYSQFLQSTHRDTKTILPDIMHLRDELRKLPDDQARFEFQNVARAYHLTPDLYQPLVSGELDKEIAKQQGYIKSTPKSEDHAKALDASQESLKTSIIGLFTATTDTVTQGRTANNNLWAAIFAGQFKRAFQIWRHTGQSVDGTVPNEASIVPVIPSASTSSQNVLPLISKYESSNRNVLNATGPGGSQESTASGYYQITNGTWRDFAPQAGVSLSQYPTAITAPRELQEKVAALIYETRGIQPWSANTDLLAAVAANRVNEADKNPLNSAPSGGGGNSISIGNININTQAKDADSIAQDIEDSLKRHFSATISNWDDGVAK
jgi:hypothetical protein